MVVAIERRQRPRRIVNRRIRSRAPGARAMTWKEGRALFDYQARKQLGISGEEFLRGWDAGEYQNLSEEGRRVSDLVMLMPFARPVPAKG